ncbi:hypothetical protein [Actinoplanes solisilvae]|uniref:hypothetical protein n=1 Tax=Actinoplanes solisilvae TaxID=2486853 RepID=UPI000FDA59CA|nr:hypothetical protein [Actinoplanes solisilvae]
MTPILYVAHDDELTIVSWLPLKVTAGRWRSLSWGRVVQLTPAEKGPDRRRLTRALYGGGVASVVLGGAYLAGGAVGGAVLAFLGVAAVTGGWGYGWWQRPGVISAPRLESDRDQHHVLTGARDRALFAQAADLCRRSAETWPALGALVDVPVAERQLAQAMFDLAGALEKRQELRELHAGLAEHDGASELAGHVATTTTVLAEFDTEIRRRLATLAAVVKAGEDFIRDQEIAELASRPTRRSPASPRQRRRPCPTRLPNWPNEPKRCCAPTANSPEARPVRRRRAAGAAGGPARRGRRGRGWRRNVRRRRGGPGGCSG